MMINVWHLLWIIPLAMCIGSCIGLFIFGLLFATKYPPTPKQGDER